MPSRSGPTTPGRSYTRTVPDAPSLAADVSPREPQLAHHTAHPPRHGRICPPSPVNPSLHLRHPPVRPTPRVHLRTTPQKRQRTHETLPRVNPASSQEPSHPPRSDTRPQTTHRQPKPSRQALTDTRSKKGIDVPNHRRKPIFKIPRRERWERRGGRQGARRTAASSAATDAATKDTAAYLPSHSYVEKT